MKILCVTMKYDYGRPEQGLSFEHMNFYDSLVQMGHRVIHFDFMTLIGELGRQVMNRRLREIVASEAPDLMFCVLFGEELDREVIRDISLHTQTTTINWFADDHWRFESFSRHWAPCFNWVVTTARSALPKYAAIGYRNVIKSQWGCNPHVYRKLDVPLEYDVTFVGQPHGERRELVAFLRKHHIDVRAWGTGWPDGRLTQEQMVDVFNRSRINLNLSNASSRPRLRKWLRFEPQIKARNFEIPSCGGFEISGRADDLEAYFEPDREIVLFRDRQDLLKKVRYYLAHEEERAVIAEGGLRRALRDHTYDRRFAEIFERIGLDTGPGSVTSGQT